MKKHREKTVHSDTKHSGNEKRLAKESAAGHDDDCRCKEVSKKTVPEMIRLMLNDLAFWKKEKK